MSAVITRMRLDGTGLDAADLAGRYRDWLVRIEQMHQGARAWTNPEPAFTRLQVPMSQARVALLTSAGAYLEGQDAFDVADPHGDPSFRLLPGDVDLGRLRFAHSHYDTARAEQDPNVVLPLDRLRELAADGAVGSVAAAHVGMMGFNPDPARLVEESAPRIADLLREEGVDVALLTPG